MKHKSLKQKLSLLFISILISLSLAFSSCNDSLDDETTPNQKVTLKGTIALSGALPSELVSGSLEADSPSRAAFPTTTGCTYSVSAVCTNPAEIVNGTISGNSYSIELTLGRTYTVTAALKNGDSDIFSDDWENVEVTRGNAATLSHDFILKGKSGGSGSIELNITVPSSVKSVKASSSSSGWDSSSPSFTLDSTTATLSCSSINAGTYEVTLDFYDSTDESNRILLYSCTQSINVVENMKTNLWKESSSASSPISNDTFTLTDALITSFERTQIYVGDTSVGTASESGSGSPYAPFATFEKALNIITNQGASDKDYTIWISGTITGTQELSNSLTGKAQSITISGTSGNSTDVLNGNNGGTTLTVSTSVPVTIKNLKITGGSAENGGGINNSGTLSLSDGCLVAGNTASNFGGGVYSTGTMFMYGSAVIGDLTKTTAATDTTETGCSNKAEYGAGIYSLGNLYLGYSAANKKTELTGGVFYNFSHDTGGIYQYANKTFLMNSGSVSYNAGRGIYVGNCSFTMSGGSVIGNTTFEPGNDYQTNGAGIYAGVASTVLISGGTISENKAGEDGGGLYIAKPETSVTIEGGTISGNSADGKGNGIAIADGYLKMKGNASVDSNNDVYLASGKIITVTGALTGTDTVATITPASYQKGTQVVGSAAEVTLTQAILNKFAIADDSWIVKLSEDKGILDSPIFVAGANHSENVSDVTESNQQGKKTFPFAKLSDAFTLCTDSGSDYTIIVDGKVTGTNASGTIGSSVNANSITIQGASGSSNDILDRGLTNSDAIENGSVLTISKNIPVTIRNLKITGGNTSGDGGGINISAGTVTIEDGTEISGNKAADGGGIISGGTLKLAGGTISGNTASNRGGGVYNNGGTIFLYGSALIGDATETIAKSDSYSNSAKNGGGIYGASTNKIYIGYKDEETVDSDFSGGICRNFASEDGGAVYITDAAEKFEIAKGSISYNAAGSDGGAIYNNTSLNVNDEAKISNNNAEDHGGAVYNYGTFVMKKGEISENTVNGSGGGVYNLQSFTFEDGKINSNTAKSNTAKGGGVLTAGNGSNFTMTGGEITGNTVDNNNEGPNSYTSGGAGIAMGSYSSGGGTPYAGTLKITGGSIHDNTLTKSGTDADTQVVGSGVFVIRAEESNFIIGENAYIYNDNIYVDQDQTISICSALSQHSQSATLKITLYDPASYESTALLVKDALVASDIVSSEYNKFSIENPGDGGKNWITLSDGKLKQAFGTKFGFSLKDIVFNDGSTMPYSADMTLTNYQKQNAVAVIGWRSGSTYYGIGLKEPNTTGKPWVESTSVNGYASVGATSDNGLDNMSKITGQTDFDDNNYPAFYWAAYYKTKVTNLGNYSDDNWYIPSAKELQGIFGQTASILSDIMTKLGTTYATTYSKENFYMTSSEDGTNTCKAVKGSSPNSYTSKSKTANLNVRAVHQFE